MDECGIDTYLYRQYGYARRGQKVFDQIRGRKYQRCGIVAAQMADRILAPLQYSGTMDSTLFEFWFTEQRLPSLEKGAVIVMDNASFHSKKRLISLAQNAGYKLIFLPPYSPDLNPIEKFWAWLKCFYVKSFHPYLLSMTLSLPLFNCGDYMQCVTVDALLEKLRFPISLPGGQR